MCLDVEVECSVVESFEGFLVMMWFWTWWCWGFSQGRRVYWSKGV